MDDLTPVTSSSINAIGYDPETQALHVEFSSGQRYEYPGITPETHQTLLNAPSVGAHFSKHIRPNHSGRKL